MSASVAVASSAWSCAQNAVNSHSPVRRLLDETEQEEQPGVGVPERVALEVEEHVAVVGRRQRGEADRLGSVSVVDERRVIGGRRHLQQLERWLLVGSIAGPNLEARPDGRTSRGAPDRGRPPRGRVGGRVAASAAIVVTPSCWSVSRSARADTGDVHERIGRTPLGVAHQLELAELAVVARLGAGGDLDVVGQELRQAGPADDASTASTSATRIVSLRA